MNLTLLILILVAIILVATLFIIYALQYNSKVYDNVKYLEQIVSTIDTNVKEKSDAQWYIHIDKEINKLRRAATYDEGNVDTEIKSLIRQLTIWMLTRKS